MNVRMHTTAASPDAVLHAGEVYSLPAHIAEPLLKGRSEAGEPYASKVDGPVKARRLPPQPDPQDVPPEEAPAEFEEFDGEDEE